MKASTRRRKQLRLQRAYDTYNIRFGNAGFVIVYKNGKRMKKINSNITFSRRKPNVTRSK